MQGAKSTLKSLGRHEAARPLHRDSSKHDVSVAHMTVELSNWHSLVQHGADESHRADEEMHAAETHSPALQRINPPTPQAVASGRALPSKYMQ